MKTVQFTIPDDVLQRFEKVAAARGADYVSVNNDDVKGRDALLTDLMILGLDMIEADDQEIPDDKD